MSDLKINKPWGMDLNAFCMMLHLSQFAGYLIPYAGFLLPIIMWATTKDDSPVIDKHGKIIFNWMLSVLIYSVICFILIIVLVGFLGFFVLGLCSLIFIIMGAIKAGGGAYWHYPLSIKFFKVEDGTLSL